MRLNLVSAVTLALAFTTASSNASAQIRTPGSDARVPQALSSAQRDAVIAAIGTAFRTSYVFPEKVPAIAAKLDRARKAGRYTVTNPNEFAGLITADLREASHDGHAFLAYDPARFAAASAVPAGAPAQDLADFDTAVARRDHYGLAEQRILAGNVRYLKIAGFEWVSDETGKAYDDAMRFLKGGDAVIIDLRGNGGGSSEAVQYLVSHFLKAGTLEITFLEAGHDPVQTRVLDNLPAGRMIGKPLYVLVDQGSASAAESFAYDVQQFKLGQLVGATTAGAANNNAFVPIAPGFMLSVSMGRPVHAVSKTNWEGIGVAPDVAAVPAQALDQAHLLAVQALRASPASAEIAGDYAWALPDIEARLHPVGLPAAAATAPGTYGKYVVTRDTTGLWIARPGHPLWPAPRRLTPLNGDGLFAVDGIDILRVAIKPDTLELLWKGEETPRVLKRV
ncbi:S41 family peptidase [Novosphingobium gossypii]|uniref:S41 family peptidase n=1 Tax=Novosphingobium gossypii TaxID=1604774 RepID=UPI003D1ABCA7